MEEKLFERFTKKSLELKKQSREKAINYMLNGKATIILLTVGLIKKILLYKLIYFPEPHTHSKENRN